MADYLVIDMAGSVTDMDGDVRITLIANAGLLINFNGVSLVIDGVFGPDYARFSWMGDVCWQHMLAGESPFETIDYILVTHDHPDHFSSDMLLELVRTRPIKGLFLPDTPAIRTSPLLSYVGDQAIPCVLLSSATDRADYRIEPAINVHGYMTAHLGEKYRNVAHICYLLTFGAKQILFTADVDYRHENLRTFDNTRLRAVFVNPYFFIDLRRQRFFKTALDTDDVCVYHVPFAADDGQGWGRILDHELGKWPSNRGRVHVLNEAFQEVLL